MHQVSKPRRPRKDEDAAGVFWFDDTERLQRLCDYCKQDVEVERELYARLPSLLPAEQIIWLLSCAINERGFHVDRNLAEAARKIAAAAGPEIDAELATITSGAVTGINQIARLQAWLQSQGCTAETLDKKAIAKLLTDELPVPVRRVLELRQDGAQAAAKKITALLAYAGDDDRIRGSFRYHGAATGRWAGEGFQPQNLKRPEVKDINAAIAAVATGNYAQVKARYPRPLSIVGDCTRSIITPQSGHELIGADFSSIESRGLAFIAGEEWKLDAYRRFDATHDPADEPYRVTAGKIFGIAPGDVSDDQRRVGKTCDLAFGYQGGVNAWRKFEPERFTDDEVQDFKKQWRASHPAINRFWHDIDRAAWAAVRNRGRVVPCGRIILKCAGIFLQLKLPSGRKLNYPLPRIEIEDQLHQSVVFADNAAGQFKDCRAGNGAFGGTWTENVVSGIARDLLAQAMQRIEAAGYPIVLHVHDEIVAEVPIGFGGTKQFIELMTAIPDWASGLPIAANAWNGPRYDKA